MCGHTTASTVKLIQSPHFIDKNSPETKSYIWLTAEPGHLSKDYQKIPTDLVYMKFGMGFDRAINVDEEKWRLNQWFPNLAVIRMIQRALECRFLGLIFRDSTTGGSGAKPKNLYFNKCLYNFYVACLPACAREPVTKIIEPCADSSLLNNLYLKSIAKWWPSGWTSQVGSRGFTPELCSIQQILSTAWRL